ncbi:MAG: hypothetical protein LUI10_10135 [Lachnospiraceae bacterium]|nr:hypothetical protein [Lachnospiraceae bacterium]
MMNFAGAEKKCNKELAMCYIIYMICGSYFHRCICESPVMEQKMYLHYREMKQGEQEKLESMVIREMETLNIVFLKKLAELACEASVKKTSEGYQVDFMTGGFEGLSVILKSNGGIRIVADRNHSILL